MQDLYQCNDGLHVIIRGTDEVLFATSSELALPTLKTILEGQALEACLQANDTTMDEILRKRTFLGKMGVSQTPVFALFLPKGCIF